MPVQKLWERKPVGKVYTFFWDLLWDPWGGLQQVVGIGKALDQIRICRVLQPINQLRYVDRA